MNKAEVFSSLAFELFLCEQLPEAALKAAETHDLPEKQVREFADRNEKLLWDTAAEMWEALGRNSKKAK